MNFGGSFAATSSARFVDLQVSGTSRFTVTAGGTTTIGDGTTTNLAGLQIGFGGICVDNDGSCVAATSGRITSVSTGSGNSDLAEMYFSSDNLLTGDIVMLTGGLSVTAARQGREESQRIIGVVSTKPGVIMGIDDTSLTPGEAAFPIALQGRVPIRLSDENGPIRKGDRITLSSIPGVGMRAAESDVIVGIALEDYSGDYAYSAGFINQFGDDLIKSGSAPRVQVTDARDIDGCYNSGGSELGEDTCERSDATIATSTPAEVVDERLALEALRTVPAATLTTEAGEEVAVGQVIMFVHLNHQVAWAERDALALLASSSALTNPQADERLIDRLIALANAFVDGVFTVAEIVVDRFTAAEVKTDVLCVGNTCVDEAALRALLEAAQTPAAPTASEPANTNTQGGSQEPIEAEPVVSEPIMESEVVEGSAEALPSQDGAGAPLEEQPTSSDDASSVTASAQDAIQTEGEMNVGDGNQTDPDMSDTDTTEQPSVSDLVESTSPTPEN
jgi:hypothetical protein